MSFCLACVFVHLPWMCVQRGWAVSIGNQDDVAGQREKASVEHVELSSFDLTKMKKRWTFPGSHRCQVEVWLPAEWTAGADARIWEMDPTCHASVLCKPQRHYQDCYRCLIHESQICLLSTERRTLTQHVSEAESIDQVKLLLPSFGCTPGSVTSFSHYNCCPQLNLFCIY